MSRCGGGGHREAPTHPPPLRHGLVQCLTQSRTAHPRLELFADMFAIPTADDPDVEYVKETLLLLLLLLPLLLLLLLLLML